LPINLLVDKETKELAINEEDELIKGALVTKDGKIVHPRLAESAAA
jgi:NAD(P) transhydrogenase subunit alpha